MQLIKPESQIHYYSSLNIPSKDQLIIVEEIKMNLLAKSCFSPGLISMMSNLIASSGEPNFPQADDWLQEYTEGMGHEIYRVQLHEKFYEKTFNQICLEIYLEHQAIVFALEIEKKNQSLIRLNPSNFKVKNIKSVIYYIYMICPDKSIADKIERFEME